MFSKKTHTNIAPIVTRTIARPFAACARWATVFESLRTGVAFVVIGNLVQWMLYQPREIQQVQNLSQPNPSGRRETRPAIARLRATDKLIPPGRTLNDLKRLSYRGHSQSQGMVTAFPLTPCR